MLCFLGAGGIVVCWCFACGRFVCVWYVLACFWSVICTPYMNLRVRSVLLLAFPSLHVRTGFCKMLM